MADEEESERKKDEKNAKEKVEKAKELKDEKQAKLMAEEEERKKAEEPTRKKAPGNSKKVNFYWADLPRRSEGKKDVIEMREGNSISYPDLVSVQSDTCLIRMLDGKFKFCPRSSVSNNRALLKIKCPNSIK